MFAEAVTFLSLCLSGSAVGSTHIRRSLVCVVYAVHSFLLCSALVATQVSDAGHLGRGLGHQTDRGMAITATK